MNQDHIRRGVKQLLDGLGINPSDPNFVDTADRVSRYFVEAFSGAADTEAQIDGLLSASFPCHHTQMIVARGVETWGICPHHLLPVHYDVTVAYIPSSENASVIGVSKLCRLVEILAHRPVLQEQIVNDVTSALMRLPGCLGAGCIARGEHGCMKVRGVKQQNAVIVTSSLKGVFFSEPSARAEFMALMR